MKSLAYYFDRIDSRAPIALPIVRNIAAAELTPAELRALESVGYRAPLAVRIGRGSLHTNPGATVS